MTNRPARDVLGEALRRNRHGAIRPLWDDLDDGIKHNWRTQADFIIARLAEAGYEITPADSGEAG